MITVEIPGFGKGALQLEHIVLDFNGTMAVDGRLIDGVAERLEALSESLEVHVVTADTFGSVKKELEQIACECDVHILPLGAQDVAKARFVQRLGPEGTVALGNGRNDHLMLEKARVGVGLILGECAARAAMMSANIVATDINAALDLLLHPKRLVATLRR